jgi:hypothetical protein
LCHLRHLPCREGVEDGSVRCAEECVMEEKTPSALMS